METDKHLYRVFGAQPQWVFELAKLPPVGRCALRSLTVKTLERRADGVIIPQSPVPPLSVIEFQFGENPLVAAFQPLLTDSETELEQKAGGFFHTIKTSKLNQGVKDALEEVFVSWLGQRLPNRTKQEIEKMLTGELPELLETQMAKDILKIGEERGRAEGLAEAVIIVLAGKRGRLTKALRQRIQRLTTEQRRELLSAADAWESLDPLEPWLAEHGQ